jgi:hypothetical protein
MCIYIVEKRRGSREEEKLNRRGDRSKLSICTQPWHGKVYRRYYIPQLLLSSSIAVEK